ncbi:hypothetical protein RA2_03031 [Roseovarius sp. A-2]|uniref:hypothetical protein n=1 Tax=Roseovarius sp. A-2 TaxID=1570360 RepID=UPI0009B58214|nr:hypothetical protein [Roseovarius sp. A-2]GAW35963.1 hypothetical protein RA2_03031 [Roseovarius sp. A-2]
MLTKAGRIALDHAEAIFRTAVDLSASLRDRKTGRLALRVGPLATLSRNFQIQLLCPLIRPRDVEVVLRPDARSDLLRGIDAQPVNLIGTTARLKGSPRDLPSLRAGFDTRVSGSPGVSSR